jgi:hypothetical protein
MHLHNCFVFVFAKQQSSALKTGLLRPIFFRRFAFSAVIAKASGEKPAGKGKNKEEESEGLIHPFDT